jgi:hypothetical protein
MVSFDWMVALEVSFKNCVYNFSLMFVVLESNSLGGTLLLGANLSKGFTISPPFLALNSNARDESYTSNGVNGFR